MIDPAKRQEGWLSEHFREHEMACPCCGRYTDNRALLSSLESLRSLCGNVPITATSAYRCERWNGVVGGSEQSQHLLGRACDVIVQGLHPLEVAAKAELVPLFSHGGIGIYDTFVHVDVRVGGPARWNG